MRAVKAGSNTHATYHQGLKIKRIRMLRAISLFIIACLACTPTYSDETLSVNHYQMHERYAFGEKLLKLALSKLDTPYRLDTPYKEQLTEARGELEVIAGNVDVQWMSTNYRREDTMIPIKIPIYRWILGMRLMLVNHEKHWEISQIQTLNDLRNYTAAHGTHWGDLPVYAANGLKVNTHVDYQKLFKLVKKNRADYFHRGVNEIWDEIMLHSNELTIADNVMLFYPLPVYFFVSKHRPELAIELESGLNLALADGSFKQLFQEHHQSFISQANLGNRRMIELINPDLPVDSPSVDTSWWLAANTEPAAMHPDGVIDGDN